MKVKKSEYEAEVIPGIESVAIKELSEFLARDLSAIRHSRPGFLRFRYNGEPEALSALHSVIAFYRVHRYAVPRPKALLGHEHFSRLTTILRDAVSRFTVMPQTMGVAAAGSQSSVLRRLQLELADALTLRLADDGKGELFLRLAREADGPGWEILVRTTAQPLSKRSYRVANVPGALNATVAYAMTKCGSLPENARVVNLCSGSSTILIEHGRTRSADHLVAVDCSRDMINYGMRNTRAAAPSPRICHLLADAGQVPLSSHSVDRLYADLPFGNYIGSHDENLKLYPAILKEAHRLARINASFVVLTHEVKLMERCLRRSPWRIVSQTTINLNGLHPRLFVLTQNSARIVK